jgi:OFA family oxalate/formate antiporter-like MFS transporter
MIKTFTILPTFKMLGCLYLVGICVLGMLIKTAPDGFAPAGWVPSAQSQKALNIPDKDWKGMLADPLYYLLAATMIMGAISGLMIIAHASPILQAVGGYSVVAAGSWVGILAVCNSSGRAGWGVISDRCGRMSTMVVIYIILGLAMFWLASTPIGVVIPLLIVGTSFGGFMGQLASLTADAYGAKNLPMNFGVMFVPFSVGAFIGPRLAGSIKVATGSYSQAFLIASILCVVGIVLAMVARRILQKRMNETMATAKSPGLGAAQQVPQSS